VSIRQAEYRPDMVAREPKASLDRRLRAAATTFWFAVQRLARRRAEGPTNEPGDPDDDDGFADARVPRRPAPSSSSAKAALREPD